ncbi:MAG: CbtA family protein [Paracoccaceae bacterium]
MTGALLLRGMIVGVAAGIFAYVFAVIFGEPQLDLAIAFEAAVNSGTEVVQPVISRETQAGLGLATGLVGYGAAIGGIFALIFALTYGRLCSLPARGMSALLGLAAFVSTALVPQLKYPANPPAVGIEETIAARTTLFFLMLVLSVICMVATALIARRLWRERGGWSASLIAGAVFVALTTVSFLALPSVTEMPEGFDPTVIWNFRISTLGIHLVLWLVIGLGFGTWAGRLLEGPQIRRPASV